MILPIQEKSTCMIRWPIGIVAWLTYPDFSKLAKDYFAHLARTFVSIRDHEQCPACNRHS